MTKLSTLLAPAALALVSLSAVASPALAQAPASVAGKTLYGADGKRVGAVYKVTANGSLQLILDGKIVTVPGSTVTVADGKVTTSLTKKDLK